MPKTINKYALNALISKKLQHQIKNNHIEGVVSLFVREFQNELKNKKTVFIKNFGTFRIKVSKPRIFRHINTRMMVMSRSKPSLKIKLSKVLKEKIIEHIDLLKTFIGE